MPIDPRVGLVLRIMEMTRVYDPDHSGFESWAPLSNTRGFGILMMIIFFL